MVEAGPSTPRRGTLSTRSRVCKKLVLKGQASSKGANYTVFLKIHLPSVGDRLEEELFLLADPDVELLEAIGLEADFQAVSTMPEEIAYLNNRARCFRNPDVGWGLAVFYITELVVPGNHGKLYNALRNAGLSQDDAEYYEVHISLVPPRAKREWALISRRIPDLGFQNAFLTSLAEHFRLERAYYDAVWEEVQRVK
mgnify:CR=1 FL=1